MNHPVGGSSRSQCCESRVLAYVCFALLGLVNAILPFIVFSANYLIVPYPRWIVILIETSPALATKLLLPHILHRVPHWIRPLSIGCCWALMAFVTTVTPPNVGPPVRVLTSVFASATAAATEISLLGTMRQHGRVGLAGWGAGTGAGAVACALLPFAFTVWMASFLRGSIVCMYGLIVTMLLAYFAVLPQRPSFHRRATPSDDKIDLEDIPEDAALLAEAPAHVPKQWPSTGGSSSRTETALMSLILPLLIAFTAQATVFPGISRALPVSPTFDTFLAFSTAYGLLFQLGNFVSRTFILLIRPRGSRVALVCLGVVTEITLLNATMFPIVSFVFVGLTVFHAGLFGGAIYVTVFATAMDEAQPGPVSSDDFRMQIIGAGETAGTLCGGLLGEIVLGLLCSADGAGARRWCQVSR